MGHVNNQPSRRSGSGLWRGALLALCVVVPLCLQGCGGGGGGETATATQTPGATTINSAGGTVTEASGASVVVPANAFAVATTVRIAKDSTGAPALPTALTSSGSVYMVTPHGGSFAQPVEVHIPAPNVTLLPTQELKLAKAEPGGAWAVLGDSTFKDGMLSAKVSSFSYFVAITITYVLPISQAEPWKVVLSQTCNGAPCINPIGAVSATITWTTNGGQLPAICTSSNSHIEVYERSIPGTNVFPVSSGSMTRTVVPPFWDFHQFDFILVCDGHIAYSAFADIIWIRTPYPGIEILRMPAQLDVVEGLGASIEPVLRGGAVGSIASTYATPTSTNRAIIDWQRSDDQGASWRLIARSFQDEANPSPVGTGFDWRYWSVSHGFIASAADQGALIRVYACYTPPDVAAAPCVTGPPTRLNVLQQSALPTITNAPRSLLVRSGQTASLSASAGGAPTPTLQWQSRPANSTGAWTNVTTGTGGTTSNYTTDVLALSDNGMQLRVVATNAVSSAESNPVTVSVSDVDVAPSISTQPGSLNVSIGNDAAFAIAARGTEAMSYQWQFNLVDISGANSPVLRLAAVTSGQSGSYRVVVSNAAGTVTSDTATLTVTSGAPAAVAPTVVTQPVPVTVNAGNTATFAAGVSGTGPFTYQWLKGGQPISGATAAFYSIAAAAVGDAGSYSVRVTNSVNTATSSSASLTVNANPVISAVAINSQPSPQIQLSGGSATFAVAASGTGPLSYQWMKDGAPIAGATDGVLLIPNLQASDVAAYSVTVSNSLGGVTSNAASLTVVGAPSINTQPTNASATAGATATFSVSATGANLRYQWTLNGVGIGGATSADYTTPTLNLADNGTVYGVLVYNGAGLIFSQSATLTVVAAPVPVATPLLATAVAAGFGSSYAVGTDGTLWAWGYLVDPSNGGYKANPPFAAAPVHVLGLTGVQRVVVVSETGNVYALHTDGTVSAWGRNDVGQLGDRTTTTRALPVKVLEGGATANPAPIAGICQIAAGNAALAMAPCDNSPVQIVGLMTPTNFGGATGSGGTPNGGVATAIPGLPSVGVRAMAMPDAAASTNGGLLVSYIDARVFAWGSQANNSLGAGASATQAGTAGSALDVTATFGPLGFQVNKIEMGRDFTLVGWAGGDVQGIGRNVEGQLGNGTTTTRTTINHVGGSVNVTEFSVGQVNAAALVGGNVYIWGWQNGSIMSSPTQLTTGGGYAHLSMGDQHGLLIDIGGQVHAWGDGSFGALGTGSSRANLPVLVMRP
jgi:hypothetical protein